MIKLLPDITIYFHAIIFLLVVLIMSKFVFNPLVRLFRRREFETKAKSREASILNRKSDISDKRREKIIEAGKASAEEYRNGVVKNARDLYKGKIDETRKTAQELANNFELETEKEVDSYLIKSKDQEEVLADMIKNNMILEDKQIED